MDSDKQTRGGWMARKEWEKRSNKSYYALCDDKKNFLQKTKKNKNEHDSSLAVSHSVHCPQWGLVFV